MEAIILAGGLGTRLRSEVQDIPKSMALIKNIPFMVYLLDRLISNGVTRIIFSVGYKSEFIQNYFSTEFKNCEIVYAIEETLLGTGGAIKNAIKFVNGNDVVVVNGDSLFLCDIQKQLQFHHSTKAHVTLALKPMKSIDRYGTIEMTAEGRITKFLEKQPIKEGNINTGIYIFNVESFNKIKLPQKFSIERDFFETMVSELHFAGYTTNGYFLDIGIPKDFRKAQLEIGIFQQIDKSWTLFLDRDGVINKKRDNDYVKNLTELELLPRATESISSLSNIFGRIIIITNQQGIGKKLMTEDDLAQVHNHIIQQVEKQDGRIDAIYHAPQLASESSNLRKPQIGMALKAQTDFPEINFSKSIMIGDSLSDMEFGKNAGMTTILINADGNNEVYSIPSLFEFSNLLCSILL